MSIRRRTIQARVEREQARRERHAQFTRDMEELKARLPELVRQHKIRLLTDKLDALQKILK